MKAQYQPKPIDTSNISVPDDLLVLWESLARNIHEVWAFNRVRQGWKYGLQTSDGRKEHPDLVPYEQLTEEEKLYDRETVLETIKVILSLGYHIQMPGPHPPSASVTPPQVATCLASIRAGDRLSMAQIKRAWEAHPWLDVPDPDNIYWRLAQQAVEAGENFLAYDIASAGLQDQKLVLKPLARSQLVRIQALALARSGSPSGANERLGELAEREMDEETLGILARTHKDLWLAAPHTGDGERHLTRSRELYLRASELHPDNSYVAINAASLCLVSGRAEDAVALARRAAAACMANEQRSPGAGDNDYWRKATLAEAALVEGNLAEAERLYRIASAEGRGRHADLNSSRRQARFLLQYICGDPQRLDHCFQLPGVLVYTGVASGPGGFDNIMFEPGARATLSAFLESMGAGIGLTSVLTSADILLSELLLEQGGSVHLVLPYKMDEYIRRGPGGTRWEPRFARLAEEAASITVVSHHGIYEHPANFVYAHQILHGLGRLKAESLETHLTCALLASDGTGSLDDDSEGVIRFWEGKKERIARLSLGAETDSLKGGAAIQTSPGNLPASPEQSGFEIKALLFADVVGYTRFEEAEIPLLAKHFLQGVARLIAESKHKPRIQNSWGDALYFVFDDVGAAGSFALELSAFVKQTSWRALGLSREIGLRIALHAGPVHHVLDPIFGRETFMGTHVSRTARIEPITEEGQICASSAFAALAASRGVTDFHCEYVGQRQLSKGYGSWPVYMVREAF